MLNIPERSDGASVDVSSTVSEYSNSNPRNNSEILSATPLTLRVDGDWFAPKNAVRSAEASCAIRMMATQISMGKRHRIVYVDCTSNSKVGSTGVIESGRLGEL